METLLNLARPAGFEPTTPWFVAKYSIQLSYGRCKKKTIARFFTIEQAAGVVLTKSTAHGDSRVFSDQP